VVGIGCCLEQKVAFTSRVVVGSEISGVLFVVGGDVSDCVWSGVDHSELTHNQSFEAHVKGERADDVFEELFDAVFAVER
jgi:hypothetical protein